jgi:hypothetical protein
VFAGKLLQLWRRRSAQDAARKAKRRRKRLVEKGKAHDGADEHGDPAEASISDIWGTFAEYRPDTGIRSIAFLPSKGAGHVLLAVSFADNRIGVVSVDQVRGLMACIFYLLTGVCAWCTVRFCAYSVCSMQEMRAEAEAART